MRIACDLPAAVALKQLVSQVSYKNELIFTIIGDSPSLGVPLLHLQQGLYNMGWVHVQYHQQYSWPL
jgi:hypothetical protein